MPTFSDTSLSRLRTCHHDLQRLFLEVIREIDCIVLKGHRGQAEQDAAFAAGNSQKRWPQGNHNAIPSLAVDVAPYSYPLDWNDRERFTFFGGYVMGKADAMGIRIRWGGDWDRDWQIRDNRFDDLVHFELVEPQTMAPSRPTRIA